MTEDKLPHHLYDRGYKMLLSYWQILRELVDGYLDSDWKNRLDYSKSQLIDKSYVSKDLEKEESDIVYKIPIIGLDKEVFLYVLIEHQSTVDFAMPLRLFLYTAKVWGDIYKNTDQNIRKQKGFRLPPVIPIVLYNGENNWTCVRCLWDLVEQAQLFGDFVPNLRYYLVDIPRLDKTKLAKFANGLAAAFLLDREMDSADFAQTLQQATTWLDNEPDDEVLHGVAAWIIMLLKNEFPDSVKDLLDNVDLNKRSRKEVKTMLETMPRKIYNSGRQEECKQNILTFLEGRFGFVSPEILVSVEKVDSLQALQRLVRKAAVAKDLAEFQAALEEIGKLS